MYREFIFCGRELSAAWMSGHYFRTPAGFIQVSGDKLQGLFKEFQEPDFVLFNDLTKKNKKNLLLQEQNTNALLQKQKEQGMDSKDKPGKVIFFKLFMKNSRMGVGHIYWRSIQAQQSQFSGLKIVVTDSREFSRPWIRAFKTQGLWSTLKGCTNTIKYSSES